MLIDGCCMVKSIASVGLHKLEGTTMKQAIMAVVLPILVLIVVVALFQVFAPTGI